MRRRLTSRQRWWLVGLFAVLGAVTLWKWLTTVDENALDRLDKTSSVLGGYWAPLSFFVSLAALVVTLWQARKATHTGPPDVAARLAEQVRTQWAREIALRHVRSPMLLQVRWSSTQRPVAAARDVVMDDHLPNDWATFPLTGDADTVVDAFRSLPARQLVVLGGPGSGKSVLAMLFVLRLLERPEPGEPVPVLLAIDSWNPGREDVERFIARRLVEEHPFLSGTDAQGVAWADRLVADGHVLPVLDGLDEMPIDWHPEAIGRIERLAASGRPVMVTCRAREYERAVSRSGVLLSRAAVVEIEPVDVPALVTFLSHPAIARPRWQPVLDHLAAQRGSMLTEVLSSPLMAALARAAYIDPATRPKELLDFRERATVTSTLMRTFVATAYISASPRTRSKATRWLSALTAGLHRTGSHDLSWRRIDSTALTARPLAERLFVLGLPVAAIVLAVGALAHILFGRTATWPSAALGLLPAGWFLAIAQKPAEMPWIGGEPVHPPSRDLKGRGVRAFPGILLGMFLWMFMTSAHFDVYPLPDVEGQRMFEVAFGFGLVTAFVPPNVGIRRTERTRPPVVYPLLLAVCHGILAGLVVLLAVDLHGPLPGTSAWVPAVFAAVLLAVTTAVWAGGWAWITYWTQRLFLALGGWLPWRLNRFLELSHKAGTIRRAGKAWHFRHVLLQAHFMRDVQIHVLAARADAGDREAAARLAALLAVNGRFDLLRDRADRYAAERYAAILAATDNVNDLVLRADAGDREAGKRLAAVLLARGDLEALRARHGDPEAAAALAEDLADRGDLDGAIRLLRPLSQPTAQFDGRWMKWPLRRRVARDNEDRAIAYRLRTAALLERKGEVDEAVRLLLAADDRACRDEAVEVMGRNGMVEKLREIRDDAERAVELLDRLGALMDPRTVRKTMNRRLEPDRFTSDVQHSIPRYAEYLAASGRVDDLAEWADGRDHGSFRETFYGSDDADARLARLLADQGDLERLRERAERGSKPAVSLWAPLLAARGHVDQAIRMATAKGSDETVAMLLADYGMIDRLRVRAGQGSAAALSRLVDLVDPAEATDLLRHATDEGDPHAARLLAHHLACQGRIHAAADVLATRISVGDNDAKADLAALLAAHHQLDDLRVRADAGDDNAVDHLVILLAEAGQVDEAIELLHSYSAAGDHTAADRLVDFLAAHNRRDRLRTLVCEGDTHAAHHLALLATAAGDVDQQRWLAGIGAMPVSRVPNG